jgi:choline dehydrogenase-like flavoprotein
MHPDPKQGVVDEHGRVHGVSNLFMAGCSVFPTGGYINSTLTIIALAVRLADHLASRTASAPAVSTLWEPAAASS